MRVINVMAVSLDGRIASHSEEPDSARAGSGFTNSEDAAHLAREIAGADAAVVGWRTLAAAGGLLPRPPGGKETAWYVATRSGIPEAAPFWRAADAARWVVTPPGASPVSGRSPLATSAFPDPSVGLLEAPDASWPQVVCDHLRSRGAARVVLLGGATVNRAFYAAGLVDELVVTVCPLILGRATAIPLVEPELPRAVALQYRESRVASGLVFIRYDVRR